MHALPLTCEGMAWIDYAMGAGSGRRCPALVEGREVADARSKLSSLQAVSVHRASSSLSRGCHRHEGGEQSQKEHAAHLDLLLSGAPLQYLSDLGVPTDLDRNARHIPFAKQSRLVASRSMRFC